MILREGSFNNTGHVVKTATYENCLVILCEFVVGK